MSVLRRFERIRYLRALAAEYSALASRPNETAVRARYTKIAAHYIALAESELRSDKVERQQKLEALRVKRTVAGQQPLSRSRDRTRS